MKITCWRIAIPLILVVACSGRSDNTGGRSAKFDQYYNQGEQLYQVHCSNCHQKNGTGLGRVYPPLHQSDFVDNRFNDVICLMRNGISGEIVVNGVMFKQAMPAPNLSDLEIAEIATYIYNTWGRTEGIIEVSRVSAQLQRCDSIP